ncbi:restriction endonuclease subunit S [Priestia megaterium]
MSESKKHPEIRYNQFTDDWELRKLGDLANSFEYGLNAAAKDFDGVNKYLRITDINDNSREFIKDGLTSPDMELENFDSYLLSKGDILFARTGASVGKTYRYKETDGKVYYAGFLIRAHITGENDTEFVYQNTLTDSYDYFIKKTSQRSGQPGVNARELASFQLGVPSKKEQIKIGDFFSKIDELIILQQLKYEKTVKMRKALLEKMFPKNGEDKPEIRLREFTDAWKNRKLGDISEKVTEKNKNNIYVETLTNSAEHGIINQRDFFDKDISNGNNLDGYYVVRPDDFVYNPRISNLAPVGPINRNKLGKIGVMSPLYYVFRTHDVDKVYLEKYFSSSGWHKFMELNGDSGARSDRFAIKDSLLREMPIPFPTIEEQIKIGEIFKKLDKTISLQQRQLKKMKNIKKALLQKMFI